MSYEGRGGPGQGGGLGEAHPVPEAHGDGCSRCSRWIFVDVQTSGLLGCLSRDEPRKVQDANPFQIYNDNIN